MRSIHFRGALRWALWAALGAIVLCAAALLVTPRLLQLGFVSAALERQLSEALNGQVAWDTLELRLLPYPRGVVHGLRIEVPGALTGQAEVIELGLRLVALLRGRVEIDFMTLQGPTLKVRFSASAKPATASATAAEPAPDPIAWYRQAVQPVMSTMLLLAPDLTVVLRRGRLDVYAPGLPPIETLIDARVENDAAGASASGTAVGNHWDEVKFRARVERSDLSASASVDAVGLKPQDVLDRLLGDLGPAIVLPTVGAQAEVHTDGRTSLDVTLDANVPMIGLRRASRQLDIPVARLKGAVRVRGPDVEASLSLTHLGDLLPAASATLRRTGPQQPLQASITVAALDLASLRAAALAIAGDQPLVRDYVARIRSGKLLDGQFSARAEAPAALLSHVNGTVTLEGGQVQLPVVEQEGTDIDAQLALVDGRLKVHDATARIGASRLHDGTLDYLIDGGLMAVRGAFDLDLAQGLDLARRALSEDQRASLETIRSVKGEAHGNISAAMGGAGWNVRIDVAKSDSVLHLRGLPWPVALREGKVAVSPMRIVLSGCSGSLGDSRVTQMDADLRLGAAVRVEAAAGQATLVLDELYPWLRAQEGLAKALQPIEKITGTARMTVNRIHGRLDQPGALTYDLNMAPTGVRVDMSDLPEPATVDGGLLRISPRTLTLDRVGAGILDGSGRLSGTVSDYRGGHPRIDADVSEGVAGPQFIDWIWRRASVPARFQPVAPLRFSASQVRWNDTGLDIAASVESEAGPRLDADLHLADGALDIRRLALKDRESDAVMSLAMRGEVLDVSFSGTLTGRSVAALFKNPLGQNLGRIEGDLRVTLDRDLRGYKTAQGHLAGENLDLRDLLSLPIEVNRIDLEADGALVRIRDLNLDWAGQKATLRGEIERGPNEEVIRAEVDTPGVVIDALLPARGTAKGGAEPGEKQVPQAPGLWPLPVTGTVTLRAGYIQLGRFRIEPVRAVLELEPRRAELRVSEAALCGIAFPFSATAVPDQLAFSVHLSARGQPLEGIGRCFDDPNLVITGRFDLDAELAAVGKANQILQRLDGPMELHTYDGMIRKFALVGNILAYVSLRGLFDKSRGGGIGEGFPYRDMRIRGYVSGGTFTLEHGSLDSDALGVAAIGTVSLTDGQVDLSALVAPFNGLDRIARVVPILGEVIGGLTSVPVRVSGDIRDPTVDPLDIGAVSGELAGIFERALKLPAKLIP